MNRPTVDPVLKAVQTAAEHSNNFVEFRARRVVAGKVQLGGSIGDTNSKVEIAAEVALEHHLEMISDPVGRQVQVTCKERKG